MSKLLVLVIGNIGTGKTTFLESLNKRSNRVLIINDDYVNSKLLSSKILNALVEEKTVVLEGNYMNRNIRAQVLNPLRTYINDIEFICFDFGPGNSETLNKRLLMSNIDRDKTIEVHKKYYHQYIMPNLREGFIKIVRCYN